jgi:NADPH2:quinone reductase
MKAYGIESHGEADQLKSLDLPEPFPGEGELLLDVHASGVNSVDYKIRAGGLGEAEFPRVLGFDVSGTVAAVGPGLEGFRIGDAVYAHNSLFRQGSNAEQVVVDARCVAPKPEALSHVEAAALPVAVITAWEALHNRMGIHPGQTVLIQGGGGGVGHLAVQLAKIQGCRVLATASTDASIELTSRCGADVVINYKQEDVVDRVMQETADAGCPVVFDAVGGSAFDTSLACLGADGQMTNITGADTAGVGRLFRRNATLHFVFIGLASLSPEGRAHHGEILRTVAELIDAGRLKPHVSDVMPLDQVAEAHRKQETQHTAGKIVLRVR